MCGGKQTSTQTTTIPPEVLARYNAVNARAEDVAKQPFQKYTGEFVAPITGTQWAGIGNINQASGLAQGQMDASRQVLNQAYQTAQPYMQQALGTASSAYTQGQNQLGQAQGYLGNAATQGQFYGQQAYSPIATAQSAAQPYMRSATELIGGGLGAAAPMMGAAEGYLGGGTQAVNPQEFGQAQINKYMSPYMKNVVEAQQALQQQESAAQRSALNSQAIGAGAFGGDRAGIAQANLARQQSLANQATLSNLLQQGYGQAAGMFQQQQGVNLAAQQANRQAQQFGSQQAANLAQQRYAQQMGAGQQLAALGQQQFGQNIGAGQALAGLGQQMYQQGLGAAQAQQGLGQTAYGMGAQQGAFQQGIGGALYGMGTQQALNQANLAQQQQAALIQGGQAQLGAGTLEQQTRQAEDTAKYQQFLQERGYDFQVAQFLANIAMGTGALSGSTTTTTAPGGFFGSDRELKKDVKEIGKTHDGLPIYSFKYKGGDEQPRIGVMADEVREKHPDAVHRVGGYDAVDYEKVADRASEGGGVLPHRARQGFATDGFVIGNEDINSLLAKAAKMQMHGQKGPYGADAQTLPGGAGVVPQQLVHVSRPIHHSGVAQRPSGFQQAMSSLGQADKLGEMTIGEKGIFGEKGIPARIAQKAGLIDPSKKQAPQTPASGAAAPAAAGAPNANPPQQGNAKSMVRDYRQPQVSEMKPDAGGVKPTVVTMNDAITPRDEDVVAPSELFGSSIPAARGGGIRPHFSTRGYVDPKDEDALPYDQDSNTDVLGNVVRSGSQHIQSLPKPGEPPKQGSSGAADAAKLIGAGSKAATKLFGEGGPLAGLLGGGAEAAAGAEAAGAAAGAAGAAEGAGVLGGLGSALGAIGEGAAAIAPFFLAFLSDERTKENKRVVGKLDNGHDVIAYNHPGMPTQIGLGAQHVERKDPDAVIEGRNGLKYVDYDRAVRAYGGGIRPGFQQAGVVTGEDQPEAEAKPKNPMNDYYKYIISKGEPEHVAAAMLGNVHKESRGNPEIWGDNDNSFGLFQKNVRGELPAFQKWAAENKRNMKDPYSQIDHALERLRGPYSSVYKQMLDSNDPRKAAYIYATGYEKPRPETAGYEERMNAAEQIRNGTYTGKGVMPTDQARRQVAGAESTVDASGRRRDYVEGKPVSGGLTEPPMEYRTGKPYESWGDFLTSRQFIVPALSGLGAMAASPSRYWGGALLQGLGAAAQSYAGMEKPITEGEEKRAATGTQQAVTELTYRDLVNKAINADEKTGIILGVNVYKNGKATTVSVREFNEALRAGRPYALDPRGEYLAREEIPERSASTAGAGKTAGAAGASGAQGAPGAQTGAAGQPSAPVGPIYKEIDPDTKKLVETNSQNISEGGYKSIDLKNPEYNPFTAAAQQANRSYSQREEFNKFANAFATMDKSNLGAFQQNIKTPFLGYVNSLIRQANYTFGQNIPEIGADDIGKSEVINKIAKQLAGLQDAATGQRSYASLSQWLETVPTTGLSPKGVESLLAGMFTQNQKPIDKNSYLMNAKKYAMDNNLLNNVGQSQYIGYGLEQNFERKMARQYAEESQQFQKMLFMPITITDPATGAKQKTTMIGYLSQTGGYAPPDLLRYMKEKGISPEMARYFGGS